MQRLRRPRVAASSHAARRASRFRCRTGSRPRTQQREQDDYSRSSRRSSRCAGPRTATALRQVGRLRRSSRVAWRPGLGGSRQISRGTRSWSGGRAALLARGRPASPARTWTCRPSVAVAWRSCARRNRLQAATRRARITRTTSAWWTSADWKAAMTVGLFVCNELPMPGTGLPPSQGLEQANHGEREDPDCAES